MSFALLKVRFQSAGMIPAPYTHFYELAVRPAGTKPGLQADFSITYPDREELDEEDITGEGFTLTDNFSWSGTLGAAWLPVVDNLVKTTKLGPFDETALGEDDDFLEVTIDSGSGSQTGTPTDADAFGYAVQELIQAIYEAGGKEKPLEISYLSYQQRGDIEVHLQARFAERTVALITVQQRQERRTTLLWSDLQPIMNQVFAHDYDPAEGLAKPPKRDGHFLSIGGDEWYDISPLTDVHDALSGLLTR